MNETFNLHHRVYNILSAVLSVDVERRVVAAAADVVAVELIVEYRDEYACDEVEQYRVLKDHCLIYLRRSSCSDWFEIHVLIALMRTMLLMKLTVVHHHHYQCLFFVP